MPDPLRIAYFAHSLRSDWNNGNAHFLRGLMRALVAQEHQVTIFELASEWSLKNLLLEEKGRQSLEQFRQVYPELDIRLYTPNQLPALLKNTQSNIVILHEWNPPALAHTLLNIRNNLRYKLIFHDTHHRASSSPESFAGLNLECFDGVLAFGNSLRTLYRERFGLTRVWTLHEAADTTVFKPIPDIQRKKHAVWIGNWGEGERSIEIGDYFLRPASILKNEATFTIHGVRYPPEGLAALQAANVRYAGYLPNLAAPKTYAAAAFTVHIPRQQYTSGMAGIPTIRVFEALACGVPLISAPWQDIEHLFRQGDFLWAANTEEVTAAMRFLLHNPEAAQAQAANGRETVLAHHTCAHRARQLTGICQDLLA